MGKVATGSEQRPLVPARTYYAIVCGVYDIGTQPGGKYDPSQQFIVMFELHKRKKGGGTEPARDPKGEVYTISAFVNFYLGNPKKPSNLLKLAEALEGRSFSEADIKAGYDIETAVGKACKVQVIHKDEKARVESFAKLDEDDDTPEAVLDHDYFELGPDREIPARLPKFVQDFIKKSLEVSGGGKKEAVGAGVGGDDEDIPF